MTSQQTFTCLKSTRETLEFDVVVMSLFLPLNIIHTIFKSLLLTLNRKIFIQIAFSDYETISVYIVQTIKRFCQVYVQATLLFKIISNGMFQKEAIFLLLLGYIRRETTWLAQGDISLTQMLLICQISFIFILC